MNTRFIQNAIKYKSYYLLSNTGLYLSYLYTQLSSKRQNVDLTENYSKSKLEHKPIDYQAWENMFKNVKLPAAIVDLDAIDHNLKLLNNLVYPTHQTIRLATKSIRVTELMHRAFKKGPFKGVMCYSVEEAKMLFYQEGINNLLIAYPTRQPSDLKILRDMHLAGAEVSLVVDSIEHLQHLSTEMKNIKKPFPVLIEVDMSLRFLGGRIHLGARRSPVRTTEDLQILLAKSRHYPCIKVIGVMAYEAMVAGFTDKNPYKTLLNPIAYLIRKYAAYEIARKRAKIPKVFEEMGMTLEIFNGGGTGSINLAIQEAALTEVTVGNALTCPPIVHYYSNLKEIPFRPAVYFALPVGRSSDPDSKYPIITCTSGGFIGSGEPGLDKLPVPVSPEGLHYISAECSGEVQTPLEVRGTIIPQSMVFFRPVKFGELAERFTQVYLVQDGKIVDVVPTYRGKGYCFP